MDGKQASIPRPMGAGSSKEKKEKRAGTHTEPHPKDTFFAGRGRKAKRKLLQIKKNTSKVSRPHDVPSGSVLVYSRTRIISPPREKDGKGNR